MARDLAEGYQTLTERTLRRMSAPEVEQLGFEMDRHMRELRAEQPAGEDLAALQLRNRKLQRLTAATAVLRAFRMRRTVPG